MVLAAGIGFAKTAAVDPTLPSYSAAQPVSGEIVCWGDDAFEDLMQSWAKEFSALHPGTTFKMFLKGTSTAVGALYTGTAQIGCFGREIRPLEIVSWRRIFKYDPLGFSVATGGYDQYNKTNAVAILVNRDNPLGHISLKQLDAIYSRDRRRGGSGPITTWGQLGLTGEWADKPIHVYGLDENTGTAQFLQFRMLKEGRWQYDIKLPKGAPDKMYAPVRATTLPPRWSAFWRRTRGRSVWPLFATWLLTNKALALSDDDGGPFVAGTEETVTDRTYPLSRLVYIFVNKDPHQPWDPKVREFLSFVLSRQGQAAVAAEGAYHPLPAAVVAQERSKL